MPKHWVQVPEHAEQAAKLALDRGVAPLPRPVDCHTVESCVGSKPRQRAGRAERHDGARNVDEREVQLEAQVVLDRMDAAVEEGAANVVAEAEGEVQDDGRRHQQLAGGRLLLHEAVEGHPEWQQHRQRVRNLLRRGHRSRHSGLAFAGRRRRRSDGSALAIGLELLARVAWQLIVTPVRVSPLASPQRVATAPAVATRDRPLRLQSGLLSSLMQPMADHLLDGGHARHVRLPGRHLAPV
mmetsp:Transcript_573/g.1382  ORF Transcript_573/g.1382 Transcript_573/m.1382 type:complete len:240 (+) Transcript_573:540-1259(+)